MSGFFLTASLLSVIGAVLIAIVFAYTERDLRDRRALLIRSMIAFLFPFFVSHVFIMRETLKRMDESLLLLNELQENPQAIMFAETFSEFNSTSSNTFFSTVFDEEKRVFSELVKNGASGNLIFDKSQFTDFERYAPEIFDQTTETQTILATSRVDVDQWWNKANFGEEYSEANYRCIREKKVVIERIWIFNNQSECDEHRSLMQIQSDNGVTTYFVLDSEIRDVVESKKDIIVVGDMYCGELELRDREMIKVSFFSGRDEIQDLRDDFLKIRDRSHKFE